VYGTTERPRLTVYRSNRHFHAQVIDDSQGKTLVSASSLMKDLRDQVKSGGNKAAATVVGEKLAEAAKSKGIRKVVFDRNFYRFHGRVRAFAEAAATGGLDFLTNPDKPVTAKEDVKKTAKEDAKKNRQEDAKAPKEKKSPKAEAQG